MKKAFGDAPRLSMLMGVGELGSMAALLDDGITAIDWDKEISLGSLAQTPRIQARPGTVNRGLRILVTGATGSLGRFIVPRLARHERIAEVTCLVRPASDQNLEGVFPDLEGREEKVRIVKTLLPALPSDSEIGEVDLVVHCAADRTFWDGYGTAKIVNVDSAKALARLCLRLGASLHVLSSGAVAIYEGNDDKSLPRAKSGRWVCSI